MLKGKGKGKGKGSPHSSETPPLEDHDVEDAGLGVRRDAHERGHELEEGEEDEEDYVIRPNGTATADASMNGMAKGKGKGKAAAQAVDGFGDATEGDEELYS